MDIATSQNTITTRENDETNKSTEEKDGETNKSTEEKDDETNKSEEHISSKLSPTSTTIKLVQHEIYEQSSTTKISSEINTDISEIDEKNSSLTLENVQIENAVNNGDKSRDNYSEINGEHSIEETSSTTSILDHHQSNQIFLNNEESCASTASSLSSHNLVIDHEEDSQEEDIHKKCIEKQNLQADNITQEQNKEISQDSVINEIEEDSQMEIDEIFNHASKKEDEIKLKNSSKRKLSSASDDENDGNSKKIPCIEYKNNVNYDNINDNNKNSIQISNLTAIPLEKTFESNTSIIQNEEIALIKQGSYNESSIQDDNTIENKAIETNLSQKSTSTENIIISNHNLHEEENSLKQNYDDCSGESKTVSSLSIISENTEEEQQKQVERIEQAQLCIPESLLNKREHLSQDNQLQIEQTSNQSMEEESDHHSEDLQQQQELEQTHNESEESQQSSEESLQNSEKLLQSSEESQQDSGEFQQNSGKLQQNPKELQQNSEELQQNSKELQENPEELRQNPEELQQLQQQPSTQHQLLQLETSEIKPQQVKSLLYEPQHLPSFNPKKIDSPQKLNSPHLKLQEMESTQYESPRIESYQYKSQQVESIVHEPQQIEPPQYQSQQIQHPQYRSQRIEPEAQQIELPQYRYQRIEHEECKSQQIEPHQYRTQNIELSQYQQQRIEPPEYQLQHIDLTQYKCQRIEPEEYEPQQIEPRHIEPPQYKPQRIGPPQYESQQIGPAQEKHLESLQYQSENSKYQFQQLGQYHPQQPQHSMQQMNLDDLKLRIQSLQQCLQQRLYDQEKSSNSSIHDQVEQCKDQLKHSEKLLQQSKHSLFQKHLQTSEQSLEQQSEQVQQQQHEYPQHHGEQLLKQFESIEQQLQSSEPTIESPSQQFQQDNRNEENSSNGQFCKEYNKYFNFKPSIQYKCFKCSNCSYKTFEELRDHQKLCFFKKSTSSKDRNNIANRHTQISNANQLQQQNFPTTHTSQDGSLTNNQNKEAVVNNSTITATAAAAVATTTTTTTTTEANSTLNKYMNLHQANKKKVFLCSVCGTYYENWNLFLHLREIHNKHVCLYCIRMFPSAERLTLHLELKHDLEQNHFDSQEKLLRSSKDSCYLMCCICEHVFTELENFSDHDCIKLMKPCTLCGQKGKHNTNCQASLCIKNSMKKLQKDRSKRKNKLQNNTKDDIQCKITPSSVEAQFINPESDITLKVNFGKETEQQNNSSSSSLALTFNNNYSHTNFDNSTMLPSNKMQQEQQQHTLNEDNIQSRFIKLNGNFNQTEQLTRITTFSSPQPSVSSFTSTTSTIALPIENQSSVPVDYSSSSSILNHQQQQQQLTIHQDNNVNIYANLPTNNLLEGLLTQQQDSNTNTKTMTSSYGNNCNEFNIFNNSNESGFDYQQISNTMNNNTNLNHNNEFENAITSVEKINNETNFYETSQQSNQKINASEQFRLFENDDETSSLTQLKDEQQNLSSTSQDSQQQNVTEDKRVVPKFKLKIPKNYQITASAIESEQSSSSSDDNDDEDEVENNNEQLPNQILHETSQTLTESQGNLPLTNVNDDENSNDVNQRTVNNLRDNMPQDNTTNLSEIQINSENLMDKEQNFISEIPSSLPPSLSPPSSLPPPPTTTEAEPTICDEIKEKPKPIDGIEIADEDTTPTLELSLSQPLDKIPILNFLRICLTASFPYCLYCNHARLIAVNGRSFALHLLGQHRFSATVDSITAEELQPSTIIAKLKTFLPELNELYFNLETYCNVEKENLLSSVYKKIFECFQCRIVTQTHKDLYLHNRKMHLKTAILCFMCKLNFFNYTEILCHMCPGEPNKVLIFDIQFRCCLCDLDKIPSAFRLMVHLRKTHYACDVCLEDCQNQSKLSSHVWKHKLHHLCYRCGIAYRNKSDITKHLFWKHGTESVCCKKCLQKKWPHVYHFCVPPPQFICEICNLTFSKAMYLKVHKRLHSGDAPYPCTEDGCDQKFISRKLLLKHVAKHSVTITSNATDAIDVEEIEETIQKSSPSRNKSIDQSIHMEIDNDNVDYKVKMKEDEEENNDKTHLIGENLQNVNENNNKDNENDEIVGKHKKKKKLKRENNSKSSNLDDEIMNLPALNLSESDSSDDDDDNNNHNERTIIQEQQNVKKGNSENISNISQSETKLSNDVIDIKIPKVMLSSESSSDEETDEKNVDNNQTSVLNIWENFKAFQADQAIKKTKEENDDEDDDTVSTVIPSILHVVQSDHDYCCMYKKLIPKSMEDESENKNEIQEIEDDKLISEIQFEEKNTKEAIAIKDSSSTTSSPKKKQRSEQKNRRSASESSSDSSSSSSCSCGSDCSCTSNSSSSSSSDSSDSSSDDSDSSTSEGKRRIAAKRAAKEEKRNKRNKNEDSPKAGSDVVDVVTADTDGDQSALLKAATGITTTTAAETTITTTNLEPLIQESDLETDESDTDEDFYDEHPQKLATQLLNEKRKQLMSQTCLSPSHNFDIVENSRPSTPSIPEDVMKEKKVKIKKRKREKKTPKHNITTVPTPPPFNFNASTSDHYANANIFSQQNGAHPAAVSIHQESILPATSDMIPSSLVSGTMITTPAQPSLSINSTLTTPLPSPLIAAQRPASATLNRLNSTGSNSDAEAPLKRSKRTRRPNKFYGYTSDEETTSSNSNFPTSLGAFKPIPPPNFVWRKEDLPAPSSKSRGSRGSRKSNTAAAAAASTATLSTPTIPNTLSNVLPPIPPLIIRPGSLSTPIKPPVIEHKLPLVEPLKIPIQPSNVFSFNRESQDSDTSDEERLHIPVVKQTNRGHRSSKSSRSAKSQSTSVFRQQAQQIQSQPTSQVVLSSPANVIPYQHQLSSPQPLLPPPPQYQPPPKPERSIPPALLQTPPDFSRIQYFQRNNIRYPIRPPYGARPPREGETVYCYCRYPYDEVSEMIACDGDGCLIEWFHFECVGILVPPTGKWFCPECRLLYSNETTNDSSDDTTSGFGYDAGGGSGMNTNANNNNSSSSNTSGNDMFYGTTNTSFTSSANNFGYMMNV